MTDTHPYEVMFQAFTERRRRAELGQVVIKGGQLPWQTSRQGRSKYYLHIEADGVAVQDWMVFRKEVMTESGAHIHQGGLVIYVLRGHGYSVFDGTRLDWKQGDLLVLPVKPDGVEHQHFNCDPAGSSEWIAFVFLPFLHATGSVLTQVKEQTAWRDEQEEAGRP
jgi:quercetin dioxygenase-like cupin family protein